MMIIYQLLIILIIQQVSASYIDTNQSLIRSRSVASDTFKTEKCEKIEISYCQNLPYTHTLNENQFGSIDQNKVRNELVEYERIIKLNCSKFAEQLFCSYYLPVCTIRLLRPCKELCDRVQEDCADPLRAHGESWPDTFNCNRFETFENTKLCYLAPNLPPSKPTKSIDSKTNFVCPIELRKPANSSHVFRMAGVEAKNCAYPCEKFNDIDEFSIDRIRLLVFVLAVISLIINLLLLLTYAIDRKRFHYPNKAIVFMSVCYLFISIVHIAGYLLKDQLVCEMDDSLRKLGFTTQTLSNGDQLNCKLSFIVINFLTICALLWWIILSIAFYLEMVLMWATEALDKKSYLFHIMVLSLAGLHTGYAVIQLDLQGDPLTGLCEINLNQQFNNLIVPEIMILAINLIVFAITICYFFKVKQILKLNHYYLKKFESLFFRMLIFLIIFLIAYAGQFLIFYYEFYNFDLWTRQWYKRTCDKYSRPGMCPDWVFEWKEINKSKPTIAFNVLKYSSYFLPSLAPFTVLFSVKTLKIWSRFLFNKK